MTTTTVSREYTFFDVFRVPFVKTQILNSIKDQSVTHNRFNKNKQYIKGKQLASEFAKDLRIISTYGVNWDFIKPLLGDMNEAKPEAKLKAIRAYCSHPNANLTTTIFLLEWFKEFTPGDLLLDEVAEAGHLDILTNLLDRFPDALVTEDALDGAAKNGHLATVQYLHKHRKDGASTMAMDYAAANGHLAVVEFLQKNRSEGCTFLALDNAAANGLFDMAKLLCEGYPQNEISEDAQYWAVQNGHKEIQAYFESRLKSKMSE
ncbi:hypothetical protein DFA_12344 [Cavenderia fasciculata]|uniref:Ankyrin repeat-containing protein n=1 Tax=Cavenderia fasciculata TaxID=261658 RepID=F4QDE9_CACFS|nr:uncharacterized protein DFA_12344 [Cavenderia fasciculata]EGG14567.1 hypothetical protein DFA_12344 [Cavenderia fasciculata]|eukprot:XP_004366087.1 hypothetical protein DFA_12344 [Cavenderia fasciculata]